MIEIQNLCKSFDDAQVLKNINLTIQKGDVIAVIGPSGSGKTTLLRCMNFLEKADSGFLIFDDEKIELNKATVKQQLKIRRKTGFVFQNFALFRNKTVLGNVMEGLVSVRKIKKEAAREIAIKCLNKVGMGDKLDSRPHELSGGQQQRVSIARALAVNPEIIYFDEPTSALDPQLIGEVLSVMKKLAEEGMTMIVVTHEMNFAKNVSNKVFFMQDGQIIESGESQAFFQNPKDDRCKKFIQNIENN